MKLTRFSHATLLVLSGVGSGMVLAYWGGLILWGAACLLLVALALLDMRGVDRATYTHEARDEATTDDHNTRYERRRE